MAMDSLLFYVEDMQLYKTWVSETWKWIPMEEDGWKLCCSENSIKKKGNIWILVGYIL